MELCNYISCISILILKHTIPARYCILYPSHIHSDTRMNTDTRQMAVGCWTHSSKDVSLTSSDTCHINWPPNGTPTWQALVLRFQAFPHLSLLLCVQYCAAQ